MGILLKRPCEHSHGVPHLRLRHGDVVQNTGLCRLVLNQGSGLKSPIHISCICLTHCYTAQGGCFNSIILYRCGSREGCLYFSRLRLCDRNMTQDIGFSELIRDTTSDLKSQPKSILGGSLSSDLRLNSSD